MEPKYFATIFCICCVFQVNSAQLACNESIHTVCDAVDSYQVLSEDNFDILKDEGLIKHCRNILDDIGCKRNYLSSCKPTLYPVYEVLTSGVKDVFSDLCNETSSFRKDYQMHGPCLGNQTEEYENCVFTSVAEITSNDVETDEGSLTTKMIMARFCGLYNTFRSCAILRTRNKCGDAAANHFEVLLNRTFGALQELKCN